MILFSFEKQQLFALTGFWKPSGLSIPVGGPILGDRRN
jgi:hypothetical protein